MKSAQVAILLLHKNRNSLVNICLGQLTATITLPALAMGNMASLDIYTLKFSGCNWSHLFSISDVKNNLIETQGIWTVVEEMSTDKRLHLKHKLYKVSDKYNREQYMSSRDIVMLSFENSSSKASLPVSDVKRLQIQKIS